MPANLPAPLVPPDVDLRGMPFMPLMGDRLFKSTTWLEATSDAKVAALRLWWHSFAHEVPAASLPDSDHLLAAHAGLTIRAWRRVKAQAMRGWILCSDGRWHHGVVAELALEAWGGRLRNREKVRKSRERKRAARGAEGDDVTVTETGTRPLRNRREGQLQREGQSPPQPPRRSRRGPSSQMKTKILFAQVLSGMAAGGRQRSEPQTVGEASLADDEAENE